MTIQRRDCQRNDVRKAIRQAKWIMSLLQGTMSLEGQGLDAKAYRELKRDTIREFIDDHRNL